MMIKKIVFGLMLIASVAANAAVKMNLANDTLHVEFSTEYIEYDERMILNSQEKRLAQIVLPDCSELLRYYIEHQKQIKAIKVERTDDNILIIAGDELKKFKSISKKEFPKNKTILQLFRLFHCTAKSQYSLDGVYYTKTVGRYSLTDYTRPVVYDLEEAYTTWFIRDYYFMQKPL